MNKVRPSLKKKEPYRMRKNPNKADLAYIKSNFGYIPFHVMAADMNITNAQLTQWAKLTFTPESYENQLKRIEANLIEMELNETIEAELMNEYDVNTIRRSFGNVQYVRTKRVYTLNRMFYLVTIDNSFNYLVKFNTAVDMTSIEFCPAQTGCDYEVKPVGYWEWMHLRDDLPVVEITSNDDYIGSFWHAFDQMKTKFFE